MTSGNYSQWSSQFKSLCGKFGLRPHIDGSQLLQPLDPHWDLADNCVDSWLFGSVDNSVLDLAMEHELPARDIWMGIESLFRANKEPRAIFLSHEFHSMT